MAPRRHAVPSSGGPVVCRFGSPAHSPYSNPCQSPPRDCAAPAPPKQPPPASAGPPVQAPHRGFNPSDPMPDRWRPLGTPGARALSPDAITASTLPSSVHSQPPAQGEAQAQAHAQAHAQSQAPAQEQEQGQDQAWGGQGFLPMESSAQRLHSCSHNPPSEAPAEGPSLLRPCPEPESGSQPCEGEEDGASERQALDSGIQFLGPMDVNSVWEAVMERIKNETTTEATQDGWEREGQQVEGEGAGQGEGEGEGSGCAMDVDGLGEISERMLRARLDVDSVDSTALSQLSQLSQLSELSHFSWGDGAPAPSASPQAEGAAAVGALPGAFSTQGFMGGGHIVPDGAFPVPALPSQPAAASATQAPALGAHQRVSTGTPLAHLAGQTPDLSLRRRLLVQQAGAAEAAASASEGHGAAQPPSFRRRDFLPTILESGGLHGAGASGDFTMEAFTPRGRRGPQLELPSPGPGPGPQPSTPFPGSASDPGRFSRRVVPRQRLEPSQPLASQLSPSLAALLSVLSTENENAERPRGGSGAAAASSGGGSGGDSGSGRVGVGGGGVGGVRVQPGGFPELEMELTPTLSALLSILSFDAEPDSPPRLQASRSCQPARSESELGLCELELDMDEPQGLQRQSSLDSGIPGRKKNRGSLGPSPTGSLHSSPSQSPVRTRESSLHSTPSPVLQRRFTGNRVSVVHECWQAGSARRGEAGPSGLRSVSEVLEEEGTAAFYRGFKADASPVRPNSKRTKRDRS